jgi:Spy/CpxP family protein refolding chaperone
MSDPSNERRGGRGLTLVAVALVAALIGAGAGHFATFHMMHGWHHGHWGHHGHGMSPGDMQNHVERMVDHLARHVSATDEQKTKLEAIAKAAATDLQPLHQKFFDAHKRALDLLRAPTIDRAAIEGLRAEQIANADAASKRLAQALADIAEVLTPQQRTQLLDRFDRDDD